MNQPANIINHVVLVLDASSSMIGTSATQLVKVADNQIKYLAQRSQELDQETRVTVYQFGSKGEDQYRRRSFARPERKIECLVYDKDVLRMPSIAQVYHAWGNTPLIDATALAIDDLAQTPEKYGEHSFLIYVLTDGIENDSIGTPASLSHKISQLPEHWTLAAFVPNSDGVGHAQRQGFPRNNIAIWDSTTAAGVEEAGGTIRLATENFMQARKAGVRGTKNLFSLDVPKLAEVKRILKPLKAKDYEVYNVVEKGRIDEFVAEATRKPYQIGHAFYQLSKREEIQPQKQIAIMGAKGVFTGPEARQLLGLPDEHVKVSPVDHPDYDIFVQSTSTNRNLMPNTKLLVLA